MGPEPVVQTESGAVRGRRAGALEVFRGIPYAAPPTGERRWRAPEPHPGWPGVRPATEFGPVAPQPAHPGHQSVLGTRGRSLDRVDEDCLTLNVWTPAAGDGGRPVLVYLHGGGNMTGAGSWDVYSGDTFARNGDVVAVTINYRIGPLGFLYAEDGAGARANFWLDDMLLALQWVRDNVAAFGGDPDRVTVAGHSGGAIAIAWMIGMPRAARLFRRAIMQGPPLGFAARGVDDARRHTRRYLELLGVASVEEARRLSPAELLAGAGRLAAAERRWGIFIPPFGNVLDGESIERPPLDALRAGAGEGIDVLIGWSREEAALFLATDESMRGATADQVVDRARLTFGDAAPEAYGEYAKARPGALPIEILIDIVTDERYRMPSLELAEIRAAQGRPAYVYQFERQSPAFGGLLHSPHVLEVPFTFDNLDAWSDAIMLEGTDSPAQRALARAMHAAWIAFVRDGDPNHDALPRWEPYDAARRTTMRFDVPVSAPSEDPLGHWRRAWERFGGRPR